MALSGTLKDFGIADILQLIGHQTKTGRLTLKTLGHEVEVFFKEGNVIFASERARDSKELLGSLLLRAELLTQGQLDEALTTQQRTLKRLGDILVESGAVVKARLSQMMRLQTTETLYKLFGWKNGSYEFSQEEVDPAKSIFDPIRAESILLEGFRRKEGGAGLKEKGPWAEGTFESLKELEVGDLPITGEIMADGGEEGKPAARHKLVYRLAVSGRTVQQICDASRIGEFDAVKALHQLIEWGYLKLIPPPRGAKALADGLRKGRRATISWVRVVAPTLGAARAETPARRGALARLIARDQVTRLESALELYRTERGEYPQTLRALVEGNFVTEQDLRYPWKESYYYRRTNQGFVLLPPLD